MIDRIQRERPDMTQVLTRPRLSGQSVSLANKKHPSDDLGKFDTGIWDTSDMWRFCSYIQKQSRSENSRSLRLHNARLVHLSCENLTTNPTTSRLHQINKTLSRFRHVPADLEGLNKGMMDKGDDGSFRSNKRDPG
jgi:hypothetical protein